MLRVLLAPVCLDLSRQDGAVYFVSLQFFALPVDSLLRNLRLWLITLLH